MEESLHQKLKTATSDLHQRIESETSFSQILSDDLTLDQYRAHLRKLYSIFFHLEKELRKCAQLQSCIPDIESRWKTASLQKDLCDSSAPPELSQPLAKLSLSQALGIFYVLEGSSLGGNLIHKKLRTKSGWESESFHFYNHHGENLGPSWRKFLEFLRAAQANPDVNGDIAAKAACSVFEMMIQQFARDS